MSQELTHSKKLKDPNYIGGYELIKGVKENGDYETQEMTLTIIKAVREQTKTKDKSVEMVLYFNETKPMIVNEINRATIEANFKTPFVEHWVGRKITIYALYAKFFGKWDWVVRVKKQDQFKVKEDLNPEHKRWSGAKKSLAEGNTTIEAIKKTFSLTPENEALLCQK